MKIETNERNPLLWSDATWAIILRILASYIYKWSGKDSPRELSPEERDEIRSRIVMDICTGDPGELTPVHYMFRIARKWRMRDWNGDTETDRIRKRAERARARTAERDPGSRESEENRNKSPFRGMSDDSRQPTPLAILVAVETATREGLRYISDRQRKARRKPVKGHSKPTYKARPTGFAGKPRVGFSPSGRPLYYPGARTLVTWETVAPEIETGPRGKPHVPYVGTLGHRAIGKVKAPAIGAGEVGDAMARMAILGRTERKRFNRPIPPTTGIPAMVGDGTEFRPARN